MDFSHGVSTGARCTDLCRIFLIFHVPLAAGALTVERANLLLKVGRDRDVNVLTPLTLFFR